MVTIDLKQHEENKKTINFAQRKNREKDIQLEKMEQYIQTKAEKLKSALKLKKMRVPSEEIAESLGLSVELIDSLA